MASVPRSPSLVQPSRLFAWLRGIWNRLVDFGFAPDPYDELLRRRDDLIDVRRRLEAIEIRVHTSQAVGPRVKREVRDELAQLRRHRLFEGLR
jgi:hypothetical protein